METDIRLSLSVAAVIVRFTYLTITHEKEPDERDADLWSIHK